MSIDSVETLLGVLLQTGLLGPEQADEVARELGPHFDDPVSLAQYLAEIDWLTDYQVRVLFSGNVTDLVRGPYHVLGPLGEGGAGQVYKAWDTQRGRVVALKLLRQHPPARSHTAGPPRRELQGLTRLCHPNVIRTFDAGQAGATPYLVMEYVEGTDLARHVQRVGPLPIGQAADYVRQAAQGLQHAHQLGLVHRAIRPANLFLLHPPADVPHTVGSQRRGPDPVVKIIDWGQARLRPQPAEEADPDGADSETANGAPAGTGDCIAPEQARDGGVVDIRADVYSLGCTFYFLLTGRPPFPGTSLAQKALQHQEAEPEPLGSVRPEVPDELAAVLARMMAKRPADRYQIPLLVAAALRRFCPSGAVASRQ
jgi:serine/threonine-protein kinase